MRKLFVGAALLQALVLWDAGVALASQPSAPQFVAKLYTEALGRAPDGGGFDHWTNFIRNSNCSVASLQTVARYFYASTEYQSISANYNNANRLVTLYRGLFSREPDQGGLDYWRGQLDAGVPFETVLNAFLNSPEFQWVVARACNAANPGYGFGARLYPLGTTLAGGTLAYTEPVRLHGSNTRVYTSKEVNDLIRNSYSNGFPGTPNWGRVELEPDSIVLVTETISLGQHVLTTKGSPDVRNYAKMARLVRTRSFGGPMISLSSFLGRVESVWVDGGRGSPSHLDELASEDINIGVNNSNHTVKRVRADNTAGVTTIFLSGNNNGRSCDGAQISDNLITSYSSSYSRLNGRPTWADGITVFCERATIERNQIVDVTDAPIVLFSGYPAVSNYMINAAQKSLVRSNTVINAGNSAYWGIGFEPFKGFNPSYPYPRMFDGARIESNFLKTSNEAHVVTPLFAGTQSLWSDFVKGSCSTPPPAAGEVREYGFVSAPCSISGNTFVGRAAITIGLHGMDGVQISGNAVSLTGILANTAFSPTFRCTRSTASQPVVCAPGSTTCPQGGIVAQVFQACY